MATKTRMWLLVLATAVFAAFAAPAGAKSDAAQAEKKPAAVAAPVRAKGDMPSRRRRPRPGRMSKVDRLIHSLSYGRGDVDVLSLCQQVFPLEGPQVEALAKLRAARIEERQAAVATIDKKYAAQVKTDVLKDGQVAQIDAVLAATGKYKAVVAAARAEAEAVAGKRSTYMLGRTKPAKWQLVRNLEMDEAQRAEVYKLHPAMAKAERDARKAIPKPADSRDAQATAAYGKAVTEAMEAVRAEHEARLMVLLTDAQKAQIAAIEAAFDAYAKKAEEAQQALTAELKAALQPK